MVDPARVKKPITLKYGSCEAVRHMITIQILQNVFLLTPLIVIKNTTCMRCKKTTTIEPTVFTYISEYKQFCIIIP